MPKLVERLRHHVRSAGLFREPGAAVVAVSGGLDSVALLDLLAEAALPGLRLAVAHADHGIQPGSDAVAGLVERLAARYGVPFELGQLTLGPGTSETVARRARYAWLRDVQQRLGARYLVTAHHRDDQIETVLLRVLRGSGLAGLAGIRARARGGLVRPLLPFTRTELVAHAAARALPVHDDPANRDLRNLRSWARTVLLPLLDDRLGARARAELVRLGRHAALDRRAWDEMLELVPDLGFRVDPAGFAVARAGIAHYDDAAAAALVAAAARRAGLLLGP
ncbi:MAG: tRNA lysidine(34) synthetase TilS, partial [Gemmatimonadales bacterium]